MTSGGPMITRLPGARLLLGALALLAACGDAEFQISDREYFPSEEEVAAPEGVTLDESGALRVVVEPVTEQAPEGLLLPQTFGPYPDARNLTLLVRPAIVLSGTIDATIPDPWPAVLPTLPVPVSGDALFQSTNGRQWSTKVADGVFSVDLPPGLWSMVVEPDHPLVPAWAAPLDLTNSVERSFPAPEGAPVWGQVLAADGTPTPEVRVDLASWDGTVQRTTRTDEDGWYEFRALPGAHRLTLRPDEGSRLPRLHAPLTVDGEEGTRVDLAWKNQTLVNVTLRLVDEEGRGLRGIPLRLSSGRLDAYATDAATSEVELVSGSGGVVDTRVLPGSWRIEVQPDADTPRSPRAIDGVVIEGNTDLGTITIPPTRTSEVLILDVEGFGLPRAKITCREVLGAKRTFVGTSDEDGVAAIVLPDARVDCWIQPPSDRRDAPNARRRFDSPADPTVRLGEGSLLQGVALVELDGRRRGLSRAVVRVIDSQDNLLAQTLTDDEGSFSVRLEEPSSR